jgi:hypothetical protein
MGALYHMRDNAGEVLKHFSNATSHTPSLGHRDFHLRRTRQPRRPRIRLSAISSHNARLVEAHAHPRLQEHYHRLARDTTTRQQHVTNAVYTPFCSQLWSNPARASHSCTTHPLRGFTARSYRSSHSAVSPATLYAMAVSRAKFATRSSKLSMAPIPTAARATTSHPRPSACVTTAHPATSTHLCKC